MALVQNDFIGKGITLPLVLVGGRPLLDSGFSLIRASIKTILSWEYGQRFFLNEFGSRLEDLIEEPNDLILQNEINIFVKEALENWEKRIIPIRASIISTDGKISLDISYRVLNSQQVDNFIFPFYEKIKY